MFCSGQIGPCTGPAARAAAAVALAAALALSAAGAARAQQPGDVTLVNAAGPVAERKKDGSFIARPIFDKRVAGLFYGLRDAETGAWITAVYRVIGGEKALTNGWEYSWEYPTLPEHAALDAERAYLLEMLVSETVPGQPRTVRVLVPVYEPGNLWERVIRSMDPSRWARAFARWVVEGVHGTLCAVVERASGAAVGRCGG